MCRTFIPECLYIITILVKILIVPKLTRGIRLQDNIILKHAYTRTWEQGFVTGVQTNLNWTYEIQMHDERSVKGERQLSCFEVYRRTSLICFSGGYHQTDLDEGHYTAIGHDINLLRSQLREGILRGDLYVRIPRDHLLATTFLRA